MKMFKNLLNFTVCNSIYSFCKITADNFIFRNGMGLMKC